MVFLPPCPITLLPESQIFPSSGAGVPIPAHQLEASLHSDGRVEGPGELGFSKSLSRGRGNAHLITMSSPTVHPGAILSSVLLAFLAKAMVTYPCRPQELLLLQPTSSRSAGSLMACFWACIIRPDCSPGPSLANQGGDMLPNKTTASLISGLGNSHLKAMRTQAQPLTHALGLQEYRAKAAQGPVAGGWLARPGV